MIWFNIACNQFRFSVDHCEYLNSLTIVNTAFKEEAAVNVKVNIWKIYDLKYFDMSAFGNEANPAELTETAEEKRPKFGNRFLTDDNDVFKHNAW